MGAADVQAVRRLVAEQPQAGRSGLARGLCAHWQWRASSGRWKVRSALAILTELERQGWIRLPSPQPAPGLTHRAVAGGPAPRIVDGALPQYRPLRWELVGTWAQRHEWRQLLEQHHYLGAPTLVGANLKYLVYGRRGEVLGALGWQSAVQHLGCRDRLLGWNAAQRARWLDHVVNGVRFLVMPWVRVAHLASVMLSENLRLLQRDWPRYYGVPVWLAESFVDRQRFSGASYRAANWQGIGWTRGFAKRQSRFVHHGQSKEVYVYVIEPRLRQFIHGDDRQPLLSRAFLLAQRLSEDHQSLTKRRRMKKILTSWKPKLPPKCELSVADLETVVRELAEFSALFGATFGRSEPAALFELYLRGLLSDAERKNVEAIALKLDGTGTGAQPAALRQRLPVGRAVDASSALGVERGSAERPARGLERGCERVSQEGNGLGGGGRAVLRGGGQDGQLPVGRLHLLLQPPRARALGEPALLTQVLV